MKKHIIILLLLSTKLGFGQVTPDTKENPYVYLEAKSALFDPAKGFLLLKQAAEKGDAKAMNGMGILYSQGLGTDTSSTEAFKWFAKAAESGYERAWYNLGLAYKNGVGTGQDFVKAYQSFSRGADLKVNICTYGKGFMLYKGLGCTQNYTEAFKSFYSIRFASVGSSYMLGLCYRNGYGTAVNADSAKYWLQKAAQRGYKQALDELVSELPENISIVAAHQNDAQSNSSQHKQPSFKETKPTLKAKDDVDGEYNGYVIKYDWSGQHVISKTKLKLQLSKKDRLITGVWEEDGTAPAPVRAHLTDSTIVFNNTGYEQNDHYNRISPNKFSFKNASLQFVRNDDSVTLAGNIQLYSEKLKEPEKPMYISLVRVDKKAKMAQSLASASGINESITNEMPMALTGFVAYPNPFSNSVQAAFTLAEQSNVKITLKDMLGKVQHNGKAENLAPGNYVRSLSITLPVGSYVLTLMCNGKAQSSIVIKQ